MSCRFWLYRLTVRRKSSKLLATPQADNSAIKKALNISPQLEEFGFLDPISISYILLLLEWYVCNDLWKLSASIQGIQHPWMKAIHFKQWQRRISNILSLLYYYIEEIWLYFSFSRLIIPLHIMHIFNLIINRKLV